jgi:SAM-dependent methyltransferase
MKGLAQFKKRIKQRFPVRRWLRALQRSLHLQRHRPGTLGFGDLRRLTPISRMYGRDRGLPIHRYYIEAFLSRHALDIQGHVLEIGDDTYTRKFGGIQVIRSDVLHVVEGNPQATIVADLTCADHLPGDQFDCIIFTQTLQMIYDIRSALRHLHRILKPEGVLLVTSHGITPIHRREGRDDWGEYWHFTTQSTRRLFGEFFPAAHLGFKVYGNVLTATAYLQGLSAEELSPDELDYPDPDYEVIIGVRAVKATEAKGR